MADFDKMFEAVDQPAPAAAPAPSKFSGLFGAMDTATHEEARANVVAASAGNPDQAAKAAAISEQTGVPVPTVELNPDLHAAQAQQQKNLSLTIVNPALSDWAANNPLAVRMAHDDFEHLDTMTKLWRSWSQGGEQAAIGSERASIGAGIGLAGAAGIVDPGSQARVAELERQQQGLTPLPGLYGSIENFSAMMHGLLRSAEHAAPFAAASGATGAILTPEVAGAGGIPAAGAGFTFGLAADWAKEAYGNAYLSMPKDLPEPAKQLGAIISGVGTFVLGRMGFGANAGGLVADALQEAIARPTVAGALKVAGTKWLRDATAGTVTMTGMQVMEMAGHEIAKTVSPGDFETVLNSPELRQEYVTQIADSIQTNMLMFGALGAVHGAVGLGGDLMRVRQADADAAALSNVMAGAAGSKLRQRNVQAYQDFLLQQSGGGPVDNLFIPATAVQRLYQGMNVAIDDAQGPLGFVKDLHEQMAQATAAGGDIVVPSSAYVARLAGTPVAAKLLPDLRMRQEGLTINEAREAQRTIAASVSRLQDPQAQAFAASQQRVYDDVLRQVTGAGMTDSRAQHYAALYAAHYAADAEAHGALPHERYEIDNPVIRGGGEALGPLPPERASSLQATVAESPSSIKGPIAPITEGVKAPTENAPPPVAAPAAVTPEAPPKTSGRLTLDERRADPTSRAQLEHMAGEAGWMQEGGHIRRAAGLGDTGAEPGQGAAQEAALTPQELDRRFEQAALAHHPDSPQFKAWFGESKVVDATGKPLVVYHGTKRPDRIGSRFRKSRATSGPMSFFTDKAELASKYAEGKSDTSLEQPDDYADWFKVKAGRTEVSIDRAWHFLTEEERQTIRDRLPHVSSFTPEGGEMEPGEYRLGGADEYGLASRTHWESAVRIAGGNVLKAAKDIWLASGALFNSEHEFLDVLQLGGVPMERVRFDSPHAEYPAVFPVYLSIKNPLDTANVPPDVIAALEAVAARSRAKVRDEGGDLWNKNNQAVREWVRQLKADEAKGVNSYAWTSIPDKITAALKALGYDGIKDTGAKGGGDPHGVWIPFEETQVKSAIGNRGTFDPTKSNILLQSGTESDGTSAPRASITFTQTQAVIDLFKSGDPSSLLHETGHLWLESLMRSATSAEAPAGVIANLDAVMQWLGKDERAVDGLDAVKKAVGVEGHEKFARAFEAYLMEGKAPVASLAAAFRTFRDWLVRIYRAVSNLDVPLNDEIRGVFDRLLASEDEIAAAEREQNARALFTEAKEAGWSDAEFAQYREALEGARDQARQALLNKLMEDVRRQRTRTWKEQRERIADEAGQVIDQRSDIQALEFLRNGKVAEGMPDVQPFKLSRVHVDQEYGAGVELPRGVVDEKGGGQSPGEVAQLFGMEGGHELMTRLHELAQVEQHAERKNGVRRNARDILTDQEATARMEAEHGNLLSDQSIHDEALRALLAQERERPIAIELKALGRIAGEETTPVEVIRRWARKQIEGFKVGTAGNFRRYARDAARAAERTERALASGDYAGALLAKHQQLMSQSLYNEARKVNDEVEAAQPKWEHYAKQAALKGMEQPYLDRIQALLSRFGYKLKRSTDELARGVKGATLHEFAAAKFGEGYDIQVADFLRDPEIRGPINGLTVEQFRALDDTIQSLAAVGREEKVVYVGKQRMEKDEAVQQIVDRLGQLKQRKRSDYFTAKDAGKFHETRDKLASLMRSADASLLKVEQMLDWFDGDQVDGPMNRLVFRPLKEAQSRAAEFSERVSKSFQKMLRDQPDGWRKSLKDEIANDHLTNYLTERPFVFKRSNMVAMALNMGNRGNIDRLIQGFNWRENDMRAFLERNMRAEDWAFVRHVWKEFESFRDDVDALQRRVSGVGMEFVQAEPFTTRHGPMEGGYFPIVFDCTRSYEAEAQASKAEASLFENQYFRPTTPKGHTISRAREVKRVVSLDLDVIPFKLGQTIHDLSYREAVMQANRILSDARVRTAVDNAFGPEYSKTFRPWLQSIANARNVNDNAAQWVEKVLRGARVNAVMVGIMFRVSTMFKHGTTALSNSVGELGAKWMGRGLKEFLGTPQQMRRAWDMVTEKSTEMRHRMDHYDRDVRANFRELVGEGSATESVHRFGGYGVAFLDMFSAVPTWIGAYRRALDGGAVEADAIYAADKMVRKAHGSQSLVDLPEIQRGSEAQKLFTMFYGFFNHIYNRQRDTVQKASGAVGKLRRGDIAGARRDFAMVAARSVFYLVVPAIAEALWTHGPPSDDSEEGYGAWAGKAILAEIPAGIPILRDIAKAAIEGRDYETSPVGRAVQTVIGSSKDLAAAVGLRDNEVSDRWLRHMLESVGYLTGWIPGQFAATAQYLWDVNDGEADPQDLADWFKGLALGKKE